MNIPRWIWVILWICIFLVVLVVLKINIQIGQSGIGVTQGLVR
jgi:hypothetical protein